MEDNKKPSGVCTACECPCDAHQKHAHDERKDEKAKEKPRSVTCAQCGVDMAETPTCGCG